MSLSLYKKKRDFKQTSEPEGVKKIPKGKLFFVVQKHAATRLHYDFRLELNGVLLSWAPIERELYFLRPFPNN